MTQKYRLYLEYIFLFVLCIYILSTHYAVHQQENFKPKPYTALQWHQPYTENETLLLPINNTSWLINYADIEETVWALAGRHHETLKINIATANKLEKIASQLLGTIKHSEKDNIQRLRLLIKKSLPTSTPKQQAKSQAIIDLVTNYYFYQKEYETYLLNFKHANREKKLALLKTSQNDILQQQEKHFGRNTANMLFAEKNITKNYFNNRRRINLDNSLSKEEKTKRLNVLQKDYKKFLSNQ